MKRADDFEQRRKHIANLSDEEYNSFRRKSRFTENGRFLPGHPENRRRLYGQRSHGTRNRSCGL